ncbi:DotG/IcmE/VirB10 family protein [Burkholderia vietnamiensis]|uniref:TrbI/VirB10 family protein n=1 Tax=Burkholderia vietnamiensis TaxID=60552 RepID=UPI001BA104F9|nr:TrbI/VirB10 family protein [Burkholderia vietnamiensis]MBR7919760.1 DotG/IcmE/VirB10 family protein [Burkholderia vietnamiensis]MBR8205262.1 DotG/IcmE/VirB10 family protein [Burkholderia vietnamiensis]HDR9134708.1 DotG/IcmE/VirB10 family protein [Burkholderia vietnamiensis]
MAGNWKKKVANFKGAMGDGRTRGIYLASFAIMIIAAVGAAVMYSRSQGHTSSSEASQVASVPDVTQNPGASAGNTQPSTKWDALVAQKNWDDAQRARQTGDSAVATARPTASDGPASQPAAAEAAAAAASGTPAPTASASQAAAESAAAASAAAAAETQRRGAIDAYKKVMASQVNLLVKSWEPKAYQTSYAQSGATTPTSNGNSGGSGFSSTGAAQPSVTAASGLETEKVYARAADMTYAYMEMPANSDVKNPIRGTIVSGPLKGSTFLAKVDLPQGAEAALIHTTTISIPGEPKSLPFDAYLVDQNTMSTALASDVDHHYLARWGSFAAATFLSGVSQAIMQAGQAQQVITTPTATVVAQNPLSTKQILEVGAGTIGAKASDHLSGLLDKPATVKVDPMPVGILIMSDLIRK